MLELVSFFYQVILAVLLLLSSALQLFLNTNLPDWLISYYYVGVSRVEWFSYLYSTEHSEIYLPFNPWATSVSTNILHNLYLFTIQIDLVLAALCLDHNLPLTSVVFGSLNLLWLDFSSPINSLTVKVVASVCFLIVIRGGVPRYRYDFLTKIGWVKFLIFIISLLLSTLLLYFSW